jgi:cell division septation protein DedD
MSPVYEFAFRRRELVQVVAGVFAMGVLVFAAGLVIGASWEVPGQPAPVVVASLSFPNDLREQIQQCSIPAEPVALASEEALFVQPALEVAGYEQETPAPDPVEVMLTKTIAAERLRSEFTVQLGAFLQSENAQMLSRQLERRGYDPTVVPMDDARGRTWFLVRIGTFRTRAEALMAAGEFKTREGMDALVRQSGSM